MIWGETVCERERRRREFVKANSEWRPRFMWYPVRLLDGRVAWLETVEKAWVVDGWWYRKK